MESRRHKLRAPRARLTNRIEGWSPPTARSFADECARRSARHAADPLRAAGHDDAADVFADASDLQAIRALTNELWDRLPADVQRPVGMAGDGAERALGSHASEDPYVAAQSGAVSAYIAASVALRVGGQDAMDAEREHQADWLTRELGLA